MAASGRIDELRKRYDENQRRFFAPLANEYRKSGDLEQAIALCRMHLADAPANLNGQIVFGQALYDAGTLDEARGAFEAAIAVDPENLIALRHLGDIAREQGNIPTARLWYRRVLDADRRNEDVLAIMEELAAVEAAGGPSVVSPSQAEADAGVDTIELEEPPMRAPAPSRPSIMSLIGSRPSDATEAPTIELTTVSDTAVRETVEAVEAIDEAPAPEPEAPEVDAIDFGMVDPQQSASHDDPAPPPDSSFGFDVDLGAAANIPVATSVGDTGDFGVVEIADDSPFGQAEDIKPPEVETAADSLINEEDLHEPIDLDSFGTVNVQPEPEPEPEPPKLELVRSEEVVDTIDLVEGDEPVAEEDEPFVSDLGLEPPPPPPATMPRRTTPVVFNFDLSVDDGTRTPTPLDVAAAPAEQETESASDLIDDADLATEPDEEDIRNMPTPVIQPAVEAFATETMAELYVKQGLRHEAIGVYKQLIEARPNDRALRDRLGELEDDGRVAAGSTAREFFSALSRRTSKGRAPGGSKLPDASPPRGSLDRLFGGASVARLDEHAAESLSSAFGSGPVQSEESAIDRVFSAPPARPPGR